MMKLPAWFGAFLALAAAACAMPRERAQAADPTVVRVTGGDIRGVAMDDLLVFKGVPFAAPPVGANRWRGPQPVAPWRGIRDASAVAPTCMQNPAMIPGAPLSEDCLYLNVWRPRGAGARRLPVMVWVHGGGFLVGSPRRFDGAPLARRDVVVVTLAYRLNAFGFLAHPQLSAESGEGSGNYGLRDQIAGLEWVRDNIAAFGGDPGNVTLFGESAGGTSVALLAVSPPARGLFHRVIAQSAAVAFTPTALPVGAFGHRLDTLAEAEAAGAASLKALGADGIAAARALPASTIARACTWPARSADLLVQSRISCRPVIDGQVIRGDVHDIYRDGRYADTPALIGSNADEGSIFVPASDGAAFGDMLQRTGAHADALGRAYPHRDDTERLSAGRDMLRDSLFGWTAWKWAKLQSQRKSGAPVYAYHFDYDAPGAMGLPAGPVHGSDIFYVFGMLEKPTAEQQAMSDLMMSYWVNFARTGDPNGAGLPAWRTFEPGAEQMMRLNPSPGMAATPNLPQIEAMDRYFEAMRRPAGAARR